MSILVDNIQAMPITDDFPLRTGGAAAIDCTGYTLLWVDGAVQLNVGTTIDATNYINTISGEAFTVADIDSVYVNADVGYLLV